MGSFHNNEKQNLKHLIWIDPKVYNEENESYWKDMERSGFSNIQLFDNINNAFDYIKKIKFESTKIILSGRIYIDFILKFKENIKDLNVIPEIAIFTGDKNKFLDYIKTSKVSMNIINDPFYKYGKINVSYDEIKDFLRTKKFIEENKLINFNGNNEVKFTLETINNKEKIIDNNNIQLTFEYIDCIEKLELPLLYQSLINLTEIDNIEIYNEYIYSKYYKESNLIELLNDIYNIPNIPKELLCKYYIRLYTIDSNLYKDINNDLRNKKKENYLPFIKILYEGIKLKALKISSNKELYRGSKIGEEEINIIKNYLKNKKQNLPGAIVFSKSFLSFTKDINMANKFLKNVLYILEKDDNIDYNLSTHSDIENISIFEEEKEVLFFPFSSFEIKEIKEKLIDNKMIYEIKILYLGKYLKEIKKDKNIVEIANKIPDSEFKKQILDLGLILPENIKNTQQLFYEFKKYEQDINNINNDSNNQNVNKNENCNKDDINNNENYKKDNNNKNKDSINDNNNKKNENSEVKEEYDKEKESSSKNEKEQGTTEDTNSEKKEDKKENKEKKYYKEVDKDKKAEIKAKEKENLFEEESKNKEVKVEGNKNPEDKKEEFMSHNIIDNDNKNTIENKKDNKNNDNNIKKEKKEDGESNNGNNDINNKNSCNENINDNIDVDNNIYNNNSNINNNDIIINDNIINNNYITGIIKIDKNKINQEVRIINIERKFISFVEIKIDKKIVKCKSKHNYEIENSDIDCYYYEFNSEGEHIIEYIFKRYINNTKYLFNKVDSLISIDLSNFNTEQVKDMGCMFNGCCSLLSLNLKNLNTKNVTNMRSMFHYCYLLKSLDLSSFNTDNVTNMGNMFGNCHSLKSLDLSNFNTENVGNMHDMFNCCESLISLDLSNFNTKNATYMGYMFANCESLISLDLSNFNTKKETYLELIFRECWNLKKNRNAVKTSDQNILKELL